MSEGVRIQPRISKCADFKKIWKKAKKGVIYIRQYLLIVSKGEKYRRSTPKCPEAGLEVVPFGSLERSLAVCYAAQRYVGRCPFEWSALLLPFRTIWVGWLPRLSSEAGVFASVWPFLQSFWTPAPTGSESIWIYCFVFCLLTAKLLLQLHGVRASPIRGTLLFYGRQLHQRPCVRESPASYS